MKTPFHNKTSAIQHGKRCWAEIDLTALLDNVKLIKKQFPAGMRFIAVVKADAYGHGIQTLVRHLVDSGEVEVFAVANVEEASVIRKISAHVPIYVLSATLPDEDVVLFDQKLIPSLSSIDEVDRMEAIAQQRGESLDVQMKIDTGMGRSGVWYEEADALYERLVASKGLKLVGIYTHFSSADKDIPYTLLQRDRFLKFLGKVPVERYAIHAHNSAGFDRIVLEKPFNGVRVGLLMFGVRYAYSLLESNVKVRPVLSFHTRVCLVKNLPKDTPVSYGMTHTLSRNTRIALLAAGYGDGIPVALSNKGQVLIHGTRCPILGRVTMDQLIIDVTDVPNVQVGDLATLIGPQGNDNIDIHEVSQWANTIPWEIFCSLTQRVHRVFSH
ncbi:MAG: alanine racemase [Verrucomicrobia bacterium GWF2_51_19]|nr:MAG: alanine racemase [Verrucomicrobia bacterium GWF2_51_19]HCJ12402.1 alanine racemase [Opitutae bacterium]